MGVEMKRTRLEANIRKSQIIKVAANLANDHGLVHVSYLTIAPHCANITERGIRYHFPNKKELYQAMIDSDLLTIKTMTDGVKLGLITDDNGTLTAQ